MKIVRLLQVGHGLVGLVGGDEQQASLQILIKAIRGHLGGVLHGLDGAGQVVLIETRKLTGVGAMAYIEGTAFVDGKAVAAGELSVVCA